MCVAGGVAAEATSALTFERSCLETDSYRQSQRKGQAPAARPRGRRCSQALGAPPLSLALHFGGSLSFALWRRVRECGASRARVFHLSGANVFAQRCVPSLPTLYLMREAVASCPLAYSCGPSSSSSSSLRGEAHFIRPYHLFPQLEQSTASHT